MNNGFYREKIKKRIILFSIFIFFWTAGILFRLIHLQLIHHPHLKARVISQTEDKIPIRPKRGAIFDRNGSILAKSLPVYSIFYSAYQDEDWTVQWQRISKLIKILNIPPQKALDIQERIKQKKTFTWIKRKIDQETAEEIKKLDINGIFLKEEKKRFYPHGQLAAQVLGMVNIDEKGIMGLEYEYNSLLAGKNGEAIILKDAHRREFKEEILKAPVPGKDLILSLDETVQYIAEKELEKQMKISQASWGTVIISIPGTGEILAMANYPTSNLNRVNTQQLPFIQRNKAVHHTFAPGSTFKIVSFAAALESRAVDEMEKFDCSQGFIQIEGTSKRIRDHHRFDILTFPEVLINSSNVGTVKVAYRTGPESIFNTIKAFGFGQKTGIDFPGEETGIFHPLNKWSKTSLPSLSIGYEISVTAIQLLKAINIIANKGIDVPLRLVKDEEFLSMKNNSLPQEERRIISSETAEKITGYLIQVVEQGTGKEAHLNGYLIAGKTGTAQKYDRELGQYSSSAHLACFVGFIISRRPILSMVVVIDEPKGLYYGGQVAAPLFKKIAEQVLLYYQVPPESPTNRTLITAMHKEEINQ